MTFYSPPIRPGTFFEFWTTGVIRCQKNRLFYNRLGENEIEKNQKNRGGIVRCRGVGVTYRIIKCLTKCCGI